MRRLRDQTIQPPQPPDFKRKIDFYPFQLIGIPLLFLLPILALFGYLSETTTVVRESGKGMEIVVNYPGRINYQSLDRTEITVTNTTGGAIPDMAVMIDKTYLESFAEISFMSDIKEITGEAYVFDLSNLPPHESRSVVYESRGAAIGSHSGTITVSSGEDTLTAVVETFVYP